MPSQRFAAFENLSPIAKAALLMVVASVTFALMNVVVRMCSDQLPAPQLAFFRCLSSLIVMLPWIVHYGASSMKTQRIKLYSLRAFLGAISMLCWFSAVPLIPLAELTALSFTGPLFATAGAALFLRETVGWRRWSAVAVGFIGMLIVIRPGYVSLSTGAMLALGSAVLAAAGMLMVKSLSRTEPAAAIVAYMMIYLTAFLAVPAATVWVWPTLEIVPYLAVLGIFGALAHVCLTRALAVVDASLVMPFDYLRLPAIALLGYMLFGEIPTVWTWIGGGIIALSTMYIARREMVRRKRIVTEPPPAP